MSQPVPKCIFLRKSRHQCDFYPSLSRSKGWVPTCGHSRLKGDVDNEIAPRNNNCRGLPWVPGTENQDIEDPDIPAISEFPWEQVRLEMGSSGEVKKEQLFWVSRASELGAPWLVQPLPSPSTPSTYSSSSMLPSFPPSESLFILPGLASRKPSDPPQFTRIPATLQDDWFLWLGPKLLVSGGYFSLLCFPSWYCSNLYFYACFTLPCGKPEVAMSLSLTGLRTTLDQGLSLLISLCLSLAHSRYSVRELKWSTVKSKHPRRTLPA